ncbi:hypothetical protein GCM10010174_29330 [Kutzneria viridogrisea]|uniref:Secreted protein n=2 Tax=Kutzneria TaxID=43356 RepID=W5WAF2_9PSEU|nr:hypothetical protein [Kutzneria albida]AHH97922.1 hypothetical protein KALB_4560 [Kutzneria albida DSM 43870]MBA8924424.1 hypothetical protein [Kutzneria viridogrisea]
MSTTSIVIVVVLVVIVLVLVALLARAYLRGRRLRQRFGPEYDRVVREKGDRREAERELGERESRHKRLEVRPLSEDHRQAYLRDWSWAQEQFVDDPSGAVRRADQLIIMVMAERGYPTEGFEQQAVDLSVRHGQVLGHYRTAHGIASRGDGRTPSTEELREAMVHYRVLVEDLIGQPNQERR